MTDAQDGYGAKLVRQGVFRCGVRDKRSKRRLRRTRRGWGMLDVEMETGVYWKCKVCDHSHDLLTPDGNEEWAMHCGKTMTMQTYYRIVQKREAQ